MWPKSHNLNKPDKSGRALPPVALQLFTSANLPALPTIPNLDLLAKEMEILLEQTQKFLQAVLPKLKPQRPTEFQNQFWGSIPHIKREEKTALSFLGTFQRRFRVP